MGSLPYTAVAVLCGKFLLHALLFYVGSFSYTPRAVLCGKFLFHAPCCFMWEVSLARPLPFYVGSFSYALFYRGGGGGPLHAPCCFMWGDLEHGPCYFMWGVSLTQSLLIDVGASLTLLVLIFMEEVCFPCPMLFDIRNLSYTPYVYVGRFSNSIQSVHSCEEFLLYSPYWFMSDISLTIVRALY